MDSLTRWLFPGGPLKLNQYFMNIKIIRKFKGIDLSFELRGEIRLNRFVRTNWRLGNFFYFMLKGHHHKISKKPIDAA